MSDIHVAMCTLKGYGCLDLFGHKKFVVIKSILFLQKHICCKMSFDSQNMWLSPHFSSFVSGSCENVALAIHAVIARETS